ARVTGVESRWATTPQGRIIKTYVTVSVLRTLKGTPAASVTLEFLGGEIAGEGMRIQGMPQFAVGDVDILFLAGNGVRFSPFVGLMHGRYRVETDAATGGEFIARNDRRPLRGVDEVRLPQQENAGNAALPLVGALTAEAFETSIRNEVS